VERSHVLSLPGTKVPYMELSLPGTFAPENFRSREQNWAKLDVYLPTNLVVITPISNHLKCLSSKVSFERWKQLTFCNSKTDFQQLQHNFAQNQHPVSGLGLQNGRCFGIHGRFISCMRM